MPDELRHAERRTDHKLRAHVTEFLEDIRSLHGELPVMDNEEVEAAHRRFLIYADMIWERLLEGEEREE